MSSEARSNKDFPKDVATLSKDVTFFSRNNNSSRFESPLLQGPNTVQTEKRTFSNSYPKSNSSQYNNNNNRSHFNNSMQNRGWRPLKHTRESDNMQNNDRNGTMDNRNFNNRKRLHDPSNGPHIPRKQWRGRGQSFHQNVKDQPINIAQNRLNRIRSETRVNENKPESTFVPPYPQFLPGTEISPLNDTEELDATDITVQVVNTNARPKEDASICRFKMVLDPQAQASIRTIQLKRKEKQVIFPFPVTPNVTGLSLHERFTLL